MAGMNQGSDPGRPPVASPPGEDAEAVGAETPPSGRDAPPSRDGSRSGWQATPPGEARASPARPADAPDDGARTPADPEAAADPDPAEDGDATASAADPESEPQADADTDADATDGEPPVPVPAPALRPVARSAPAHPKGIAPLERGDPTAVGPYLLEGRLGAGGMGTVYFGRSQRDGKPVAVKLVRSDLAGDTAFRARFRAEVEAARRVAGSCTARVLDADPDSQRPYLVTEYVDGIPLDQAIARDGPLPPSSLEGFGVGVAVALTAIHAAGIVHRDLKPSNVLLSAFGPKVIDFGIARALDGTGR